MSEINIPSESQVELAAAVGVDAGIEALSPLRPSSSLIRSRLETGASKRSASIHPFLFDAHAKMVELSTETTVDAKTRREHLQDAHASPRSGVLWKGAYRQPLLSRVRLLLSDRLIFYLTVVCKSDLGSILAPAVLTVPFILASAFDVPFRIVSVTVLVLTLPGTRFVVSAIFWAAGFVVLFTHTLLHDLCLVISSSSSFQAVTRHLANATPVLLLLVLIILATWSTLSGFYPCDATDSAPAPSTPRGPSGRSPMSFRRARGIPVLRLPPDQTPTPCRERERRYLEIIDRRDAKIARRDKRIEKFALRLDEAREVVAARDATIAAREQTISENAAALAERERAIVDTGAIAAKDEIIARLTEVAEHLRSDNADAVSMLAHNAAHISDLCLKLDAAGAAEERREAAANALHARIAVLEADLTTAGAEAVATRAASLIETTTVQTPGETTFARHAAVVVQKDELVASLQADVLKLQRELDSVHCRTVEKEALIAAQAATIDDIQDERDAALDSAQTQTQLIEQLKDKVAAYEQEMANWSPAEHHFPPADWDGLETCEVTTDGDVQSLTQQLAASKQETLDAIRLQKAYEEVADAGAVRVIELVQQLEEQKELCEVDRELFLVRIRKLTVLLDKARSGVPVPDKAFAQLRLPVNTSSICAEDSFTAVTPRLPASTEPVSPSPSPSSSQGERKLRRRSAIENLRRRPLADVTASATSNLAPLGPRSCLPRPSSISIPVTVSQSPPAVNPSIP